jgi:LysM repeat protein
VIEAGDTLNRLSQRYGVTVEAIMQANNFTDRGRILRIGERFVIPEPPAGSPIPR